MKLIRVGIVIDRHCAYPLQTILARGAARMIAVPYIHVAAGPTVSMDAASLIGRYVSVRTTAIVRYGEMCCVTVEPLRFRSLEVR